MPTRRSPTRKHNATRDPHLVPVLALKGNHETVHEEVVSFLDHEIARDAAPAPPRMTGIPEPAITFATLRRMAINLLNREKTKKRGIKGKQLNA